jgi:hypothetical protein
MAETETTHSAIAFLSSGRVVGQPELTRSSSYFLVLSTKMASMSPTSISNLSPLPLRAKTAPQRVTSDVLVKGFTVPHSCPRS